MRAAVPAVQLESDPGGFVPQPERAAILAGSWTAWRWGRGTGGSRGG